MKTLDKPVDKLQLTHVPKPRIIKRPYKYTEQFVYKELEDLLRTLNEKEQIRSKAQLFQTKNYSKYKFSEWKNKYSDSKRIVQTYKKIEEIIEARLIEHGLYAKNPAFTIFLLKNFYGYQDKREVSTDNNYTFTVSRGLAPVKRKVVASKAHVVKDIQGS